MTGPVTDTPLAGTDELLDGLRQLYDAQPNYLLAEQYLNGTRREFFASEKLARALRKSGDSYRVNVARKAVTSVTDRAEVAAITVLGAQGEPDDAATRQLADLVLRPNELWLELPEWIERLGGLADIYAFVWPNDEGGVDVEFNTPFGTRAIYDPERPRRIAYVVKTWDVGTKERKRTRANLYYPPDDEGGGRIERWVTGDGESGTAKEHWRPFVPIESAAWPELYPDNVKRLPVFHFRTGRPYGVPLHLQTYGAQDALNKLAIVMMSTVDFQGAPQRAVLVEGEAPPSDDELDEEFGYVPDGTTEATTVKKTEDQKLKTGPGELWFLKNAKDLVQLDPADPDVFLKPADWWLRMMATASDMPLHFYDAGGDQPSGDSRRQAEGTLTKKIDRFTAQVESTLSSMLLFALELAGVKAAAIDVRWTPAATVDDLEGWTTAQAKIEAGVPVAQALMEAGYAADQVKEWLKNSDEQDMQRKVAQLAELAKALKDLGAATQLGAVSSPAVAQVVEGILAGAARDDAG